MHGSFKHLQGRSITLVERTRAFTFHCDRETRAQRWNLQLTGTAPGVPPATDRPWQFEFAGKSWGTSLEVTPRDGKFLVKAETVITDEAFWGSDAGGA